MYERENQWIRGLKGTENAEEGCLGKKNYKGGAVQEEGQKPGLYLSLASPRPL